MKKNELEEMSALMTLRVSSKVKTILSLFMVMILLVNTGCKKEEEELPEEGTVTVIDVTPHFVEWIYFSFSENEIVTVDNNNDDLSWDLGIRYQNFRTNGGESGSGQGGVYDLGEVAFASVTLSSLSGIEITEDDHITVIESAAMPPSWISVPGSVPLEEMFLTPAGPDRTYAPNNHIYIIKTANGKHVKVVGETFFNDLGAEGYMKLRWEFLD